MKIFLLRQTQAGLPLLLSQSRFFLQCVYPISIGVEYKLGLSGSGVGPEVCIANSPSVSHALLLQPHQPGTGGQSKGFDLGRTWLGSQHCLLRCENSGNQFASLNSTFMNCKVGVRVSTL